MDNHIKSSNFAESFLVVKDLALISICFGKLLTVTHFLITQTSNLFVINQFWWILRHFLSEFLIHNKFIFWSAHSHSWLVANDAPKWSTSIIYPLNIFCSQIHYSCSKGFKKEHCKVLSDIIIHQTHYEKSDWSRAFNQFTIACELDMINVISAADITFIMSSSTSAWLLSPLECSPQKQNGWTLRFCFWGRIMWKMYNKTTIEFGFRMISWIIKTSCLCYNTDHGFDNSWYHAQPHPIISLLGVPVISYLSVVWWNCD